MANAEQQIVTLSPQRIRLRLTYVLAAVALFVSLSVAVSVGAVSVPLPTVWGIIANKLAPGLIAPDWSPGREAIVWDIRMPRAILACLVGAGLAIVGASLQAVTRNPLADPHLLGISAGGAFGAIVALLHTGLFLGLMTVPLLAFVGALGATLLVLGVSQFAAATSADR
ncbi:MAG: iron complex transport system permease protein, partial [Yoonia sp.]